MKRKRTSIWFRFNFGMGFHKKMMDNIHENVGPLDIEGTRDEGFLVHIEREIKPTLEGKDIHYTAASILYEIIQKHPYWDGNKRTGFTTSITVLVMGNRTLDAEDEDVEAYLLDLAYKFELVEKGEIAPEDGPQVEDVVEWLEDNSSHVPLGYFLGVFLGICLTVGITLVITPLFFIRVSIEGLINRLRGA